MLDSQQVKQYQKEGFLVLPGVIPAAEIAGLKRAALGIVADFDINQHRTVFKTNDGDAGRDDYFFDSAQSVHCFLEEGALDAAGTLVRPKNLAINKIGHAMHDLVPGFASFCRQPVIGEVLRDIGHVAPQLWQSMYIFKQPGIGGEVRWHQDASYLITEPPAVTGVWIAIEDASRENGCLWMQPGQHRSPLREIYEVNWQIRKGTLSPLDPTPWCQDNAAVALEVPAGSMVLFHDHMPHYSSQNHSAHSRHAFTLHVADEGAAWSKRNWLQRGPMIPFSL